MGEQFTTIEQHNQLNKKVDDGFLRINENLEKITTLMTTYYSQSNTQDVTIRSDFERSLVIRDKEKRAANFRIIGLGLTLASLLFTSVWYSFNLNIDKKMSQEKLEVCEKDHKIELRVQKMESYNKYCP